MDDSLTDDHNFVLNQVKVNSVNIQMTKLLLLWLLQNFNARIIIAWIPHDIAVKFLCSVSLTFMFGIAEQ